MSTNEHPAKRYETQIARQLTDIYTASLAASEVLAAEYRGAHPTPDGSVDELVNWQTAKAGVLGFLAGCPGGVVNAIAAPVGLLQF